MSYEAFKATREKNFGPLVTPEYKRMQLNAMKAVQAAIRKRKLPSLSKEYIQCFDCTRRAENYDHWDYTKPLEVEPVCRGCNVRRGKAVNAPGHLRTRESEENMDKQWLASLKVGDLVAYREGYVSGVVAVAPIDRMTATQFQVGPRKFRRTDGKLVGSSSWNAQWLKQPTPEILADVEERELRQKLGAAVVRAGLAELREMDKLWRMK